jgi:hypothetical protein
MQVKSFQPSKSPRGLGWIEAVTSLSAERHQHMERTQAGYALELGDWAVRSASAVSKAGQICA